MRLLYIITLSEFGGAQSQVQALVEGFSREHTIDLITGMEGPLTAQARRLGAGVHIVPTLGRAINPGDDLRTVRAFKRHLEVIQPSLVHVHSSKAGLLGRIAARWQGVPVIYTAHGWGFKPGVPVPRRWIVWGSERFAAYFSDRIICVSQYDYDLALQYRIAAREKLTVIRNGIPDHALPGQPEATPVRVMMTARFQEPKDQATLLRAFAALPQTWSSAELLFIGSGPQLEQGKALASQLGIGDRVRFLGDRHDVGELLSGAQVFVLLSKYEGLPVSILEAMRAGLPVLATQVGGIPELVEEGATGFLVPYGDVQATSRALLALLTNPTLRTQLGRNGRLKYQKTFSVASMLDQTGDTYREVLAKRSF